MTNDIPEPQEIRNDESNEKRTELKCQECQEWYSKRGYPNHVRNCMSINSNPENQDPKQENCEEVETLELLETCPECNLELANCVDVANVYRDKGFDDFARKVEKYDFACTECQENSVVLYNEKEIQNEGGQE